MVDLVEYIRSQISSLEWRHIVEVEVDRTTSARVVCVNMVRFSRALVNFLDNAHLAVRGMQPRRIYFSAKAGKGEVLFKVEDNGCGFSDKFFGQGGFSEWGSTGIGLAFVAEVAKNHGGGMDIANLPAGGASVTVNIPLKEV